MKTPLELPRYFTDTELRVVEGDNGRPRIVGYAARFNTRSHDLGGFREEIAPGAFADALSANEEVLALVDHDPTLVLGRRSAGTLTLREDDKGLYVEIDPPDTTVGRDAVENVRRRDKPGMSFRFPRGAKDSWRRDGGDSVRTLHKVGLLEVTVTGVPAYPDTTAAVRSNWNVDASELRSYYAARIAELTQPPPTPKRNLAERRMKLLGGETRCGCYSDPCAPRKADPIDPVRMVLYSSRSTFDSATAAVDVLAGLADVADDTLKRACADAADAADKCVERLQAFAARCREVGGATAVTTPAGDE